MYLYIFVLNIYNTKSKHLYVFDYETCTELSIAIYKNIIVVSVS